MPIPTSGKPIKDEEIKEVESKELGDYQKGISQENVEELRTEFLPIGGIVDTLPDIVEVRDWTMVAIPKTDANGKAMFDRYQAIDGKWFLLPDTAEYPLHAEGASEQYETSTVISVSVIDTIYPVTVGWSNHYLHNMTNGSGVFTMVVAGDYSLTWNLAVHSAGANQDYECGLLINGVNSQVGWSHITLGNTGDIGAVGASTIYRLKAGDNVSVGIKNITSTTNLIIDHASFSVFRIR